LMDSASVVVGSMVIAPLIGPAMASSVGSVVRDDELFKRGVTTQVSGILLAIAGSAIFSLLVRVLTAPQLDLMLINQVAERVHPGILSLMVALAAGVAGALSLTSGASAALVGVMIAVALIPPAATMGLGIAYLNGVIVFSAGGLVVLNMISINLAALITLWLKGYRPEKFFEEKAARGITFKRVFILLGAVIVIALFLGVTTIYERQAMEIKYNLLETARQAKVNVIDYRFTYRTNWLFRQPSGVILTVEDLSENQKKTLKKYITENYPQLKLITTYQSMERIN